MTNLENTPNCEHSKLPKEGSEAYLRAVLTNVVIMSGSQRRAAKELSISASYLGDVLHGKRGVSDELAQRLGWRRTVRYERIGA